MTFITVLGPVPELSPTQEKQWEVTSRAGFAYMTELEIVQQFNPQTALKRQDELLAAFAPLFRHALQKIAAAYAENDYRAGPAINEERGKALAFMLDVLELAQDLDAP